jgi:glycine/sarcosine N-methyltransferase
MGKIKGSFARTYDKFVKRPSLLPPGLLDLVKSKSAHDILEFASGTGTVAVGLALKGFNVVGVDYSPDMLKTARRKAREHKTDVKFISADISKIRLEKRFDLLLCLGNTIPHFTSAKSLRLMLENVMRHLKSGGYLIFQQLNYDRMLKEKPGTFATDTGSDLVRIKQYRHRKSLVDFYVTVIDSSKIPPEINSIKTTLMPWTKSELSSALLKAGFRSISAYGNYCKERFSLKSKDLIIVAKSPK